MDAALRVHRQFMMGSKMKKLAATAALCLVYTVSPSAYAHGTPNLRDSFTNSIGMKMVRIEQGSFQMGKSCRQVPDELTGPLSYPTRQALESLFPNGDPDRFAITVQHVRNGDFDEKPAHNVTISRPFYIGAFEVTNAQYEKFEPSHKRLRGKNGFSKDDNEAVVFVNWNDAKAFCDWLSQKEGLPYRLPTEAEWEYACRAGTTTNYWTGRLLPKAFHKNARRTSFTEAQDIVPLTVGQTPPNPWRLYDMHGNVEEWCYDWYGTYERFEQTDPVGRADGDFKVTRGGSHGTNLYYLRSANRMGTLPQNRNWLIGFRVVIGEMPDTMPLPVTAPRRYQFNVRQEKATKYEPGYCADKPYFKGPRRYVKIPKGSTGPLFYHHNHDAAIVECRNGDLLAIWYTCVEDRGRELAVAASRLRHGQQEWEPASPFWDSPDRNDHCPALWFDGKDTIYHFNGLCVAGKWEPLAVIMRISRDNGATWSKARLIVPEHGFRQMVGEPVFRTQDGAIVFGADAEHGSTIWISRDEGRTWTEPGGKINGIHAGIVQLKDGRLMALGRNQNINGWMPMSISTDMGRTWHAGASVFPPVTGGQRAVLIRLKEGPLFFASFAPDIGKFRPTPDGQRPPRHIANLFGAVSPDEGRTWPIRRIITDCRSDHPVDTIDNAPVLMNPHNSEPLGYLSACQDAFGVIHLISSTNHYAFNLAWLKASPPEASKSPTPRILKARRQLAQVYDASVPPDKADPPWELVSDTRQVADVETRRILRMGRAGRTCFKWSNERLDGLAEADAHNGLTAEVTVRVRQSAPRRGFDFELFLRGGALTVNHYLITITATGVYYWYDNQFLEIVADLDNRSEMHTYRLAVRQDTVVQIYRDEQLIGVGRPDLQIGWAEPARGSFIRFGPGAAGTEAILDRLAWDTAGPFQPTEFIKAPAE